MSHEIRIAGSEVSFGCEADQTLLDAALRAGIELPYSCRKGVCGNCAAVLRAGQVACAAGDAAPPGRMLLCQCRPRSDLTIEPASWRRIDPDARKVFDAKVYRHARAADDVSILTLRLPAGQRARFRAGQYLQVLLDDGSRRCYSMASAPALSDTLELHVRHVAGGRFTARLATLGAGETLRIELPYGHVDGLDADAASASPLLCVVGGTGLAPVKSLLDQMAREGRRRPVTLLWGSRDRQGLYLMSAVQRWAKAWPDFRFIAAIEDAADARALEAVAARVDEAVRRCFGDLRGTEVYCCGAPAMVAAVRRACVDERGVALASFHADAFVSGPV